MVATHGLTSYGSDFTDLFGLVGIDSGSILKGANPADLPVLQSTKFEIAINFQTVRALGIQVPSGPLFIAGSVIA